MINTQTPSSLKCEGCKGPVIGLQNGSVGSSSFSPTKMGEMGIFSHAEKERGAVAQKVLG